MRSTFIFALALALAAPAAADWIWTPESGWVNTKYAGRETAGPVFREAKDLYDSKRYAEAAERFDRLLETGVPGRIREDALYYAAESHFDAGNYYKAHVDYDLLLEEFPGTDRIRQVAEREYRIGQALVQGEKKEFLILFEVSDPETGVEILRQVLDRYPTGDFADDARFTIANFYFQEARYTEALEEYKVLRESEDFKTSEWRHVALYQIAKCQEAGYQGPPYDTSSIQESRESYAEYENEDPSGSRIADSRARRAEIDLDLATSDLRKAKWYLQWGRPQAAAVFLRDIVDLYPGTEPAREARELLDDLGP